MRNLVFCAFVVKMYAARLSVFWETCLDTCSMPHLSEKTRLSEFGGGAGLQPDDHLLRRSLKVEGTSWPVRPVRLLNFTKKKQECLELPLTVSGN